MARFMPQAENFSLEEQLKILGDEELLDFWEETQFLSGFLDESTTVPEEDLVPEYERLILLELQFRSCRKHL